MKKFLTQLLAQFASYLVFAIALFFLSVYFITGEFPPKKKSILQLKTNFDVMNKALRARVKTLNQTASNSEMPVDFNRPASNAVLPEPLQPPVAQSDLSLEIKELRADQMRVSNQLEKVLEQNRQILLRLNSLGQK